VQRLKENHSILLASILPAVMGIKLNTPVDTAADGTLLITWTPAATDP
jgi:fructose-specific phosphotransferase system IIC component